jgi:hypothetical protein
VCSNDNTRSHIVLGKRDRLTVRIIGLIEGVAEGPVAIGGLLLIVLFLVLFCR